MRLYQLDISWVGSAHELAALRWLLAASDDVGGVFLTGRGDTLAVLYAGSGHDFDQWARTLEPAHFQPRQQRSNEMRRFSIRLFAVGFLIGAIIAAAASVTSAFAAKAAPRANPSAQTPDQVIQWNRILLAILRTPGAQPATVHPTRSMAILHAAVYDAVNAIDRSHADYLVHVDAPTGASEPAAAAAAAHDVLNQLYPAQQATLDTDLAASLAAIPDGQAKTDGVQVGEKAAAAILALRATDGSSAPPISFVPETNPGDYQLTPPAFAQPVFTQWRFVTPFTLRTAGQFRPAAPGADQRHLHG